MEQGTITNVWLEVQYDGDSFNLTLLTEGVGRQARAEAVTNLDPDVAEAGALFSLNLSDETRDALVENQQSGDDELQELFDQLETAPRPMPDSGQIMVDDNPAPWSDDTRVVVDEVLDDVNAEDYVIEGESDAGALEKHLQSAWDKNVADANPSYPADDSVILGHYEGSTKQYAFPESRLKYPECDTPTDI